MGVAARVDSRPGGGGGVVCAGTKPVQRLISRGCVHRLRCQRVGFFFAGARFKD